MLLADTEPLNLPPERDDWARWLVVCTPAVLGFIEREAVTARSEVSRAELKPLTAMPAYELPTAHSYVTEYPRCELADIALKRIEAAMLCIVPERGAFFAALCLLSHFPRHREVLVRQEVELLTLEWNASEAVAVRTLQQFAMLNVFELHWFDRQKHSALHACVRAHRAHAPLPTYAIAGRVEYFGKLLEHTCTRCSGYPVKQGYIWFTYRELHVALHSLLTALAERAQTNTAGIQPKRAPSDEFSLNSLFHTQKQLDSFEALLALDRAHAPRRIASSGLTVTDTPRAHIEKYWPPCMRQFGDRDHPNNEERLKLFPLLYSVYGENLALWMAMFPSGDRQYEVVFSQNVKRIDKVREPSCITMHECKMCPYRDIEECGGEFTRRFNRAAPPLIRKPSEYILHAVK